MGADDVDGVSADRRCRRGTPPGAARGDPAQHPSSRARAGRAQRPLRTAIVTMSRRSGSGAVEYLNARPLVFGLDRDAAVRPALRLAVAVRRAAARWRDRPRPDSVHRVSARPLARGAAAYRIVPDVAVGSRGPVASVALFTTASQWRDVRSIALDTRSRTSVALTRVLCARVFHIAPELRATRRRPRGDAGRPRCGAHHWRPRARHRAGPLRDRRPRGRRREDRSRRGVDARDRAAVRLCLLGGPRRCADARTMCDVLQRARDAALAGARRPCRAEYFADEPGD